MEERKCKIIEAATKRFAHFGFHKTTMNEIADDLRITKANLYYYYPDKSRLILDVMCSIVKDLQDQELELINNYKVDFLSVLNSFLDLKSDYMKKYYVLHINENLDWIKGMDIAEVMEEFYQRDIRVIRSFLQKAVDLGELQLDNVEEGAVTFAEIIKGCAIIHTIADVITGIPNESNVDKILESQKRAVKMIFEGRIISKLS